MQDISARKADNGGAVDLGGIDDGASTAGGATLHTASSVVSRRDINEKPPLLKDLSDEEIEELEGKLKRRIDLRLLPMIILIYILNYLDRNNIPGRFHWVPSISQSTCYLCQYCC